MKHEVWGRPPTFNRSELYGEFKACDWQWALKLARQLREQGVQDVQVKDVTSRPGVSSMRNCKTPEE